MGDGFNENLSRSDMRMIGTAVRKGWNIPDSLLDKLPAALGNIIVTGTKREQISASRVLVSMHGQNQPAVNLHAHQVQTVPPDEPREEMTLDERKAENRRRLDRLKRLGAI